MVMWARARWVDEQARSQNSNKEEGITLPLLFLLSPLLHSPFLPSPFPLEVQL